MIKKFKKKFKNFIKKVDLGLETGYLVLAHLFIALGNTMLNRKEKYQVVRRLIEELYISLDVYIKVERVSEYPLYTRFYVVVNSGYAGNIDWKYFTLELDYQLGCMISDVIIEKSEEKKDGVNMYTIDITKTAITNLEKGVTSNYPLLFEAENTMSILKKATEMIQSGEHVSPKLLENRLNISEFRAERLFEQLKQMGLLGKKSEDVTVN